MNMTGKNGFTLIEVLIIIILTGIVASFMVAMLGSSLKSSPDPLVTLSNLGAVERTVANINAKYAEGLNSGGFSLSGFKDDIKNHAVDGVATDARFISFTKFVQGEVTTEKVQVPSQAWYLKVTASKGDSRIVTLYSN
ncbi:MAG: prepilin-type N-terminal cleavage/methylation domain-containing protein [Desulfobacteraceae bacterium]|nr:prepilin-type N-terminal cleavage/methylation domain-containing protein [Desulfobacteraceae bacterium]